jgi:hypothetical protein
MDRRQALYQTSLLLGGTIIGAEAILSGCSPNKPSAKSTLFQEGDEALLDDIADTILPDTTDSPGAKQAKAGAFMILIVKDCYEEQEQKIFVEGLKKIQAESQTQFNNSFSALNAVQRHELLTNMDKTATSYESSKETDAPPHHFSLIKQLATFAYFSSEIGMTKALRYNPIPGRFDGCVEYKVGEKAWA